jgi:membrane protein DedA with SNARE-associated domain
VELAGTGLLAIVGLIVIKEAGLPIPVPGDLVVIGAGVAAGRGDLDPVVALVAIVVASIVGGVIQFGLLRSVARPALLRVLSRVTSTERIDRQAERLRRGGARSVAVARSTPGLRIVAIAASALADLRTPVFVAGLALGNVVFISAHFALGYLLGEPVLSAVGGALGPLAIAGVALAVVGAVGWIVLSRRRRGPTRSAITVMADWADACCPACLALAVVDARGRGEV